MDIKVVFLLFDAILFRDHTLPETNIAPENGWLEYYFPLGSFGKAYFQVQTVSFRELLMVVSGSPKRW